MSNNEAKTILIVEGENFIPKNEIIILDNNNYQVVLAKTVYESIEIINSNNKIDLILLNINLGKGIDGIETAKKILFQYEIPIIFLISRSDKDIIDKIENMSSYGFIEKNSSELVLINSINMAFKLYDERIKVINQKEEFLSLKKEFNDSKINLINSYNKLNSLNNVLLERETTIKASEDKYRLLSELSFEAIIIHKDGVLIEANQQFYDMTGYEKNELLGKQIIPLTIATESQELLKDKIAKKSKEIYETIGIRKNGTKIHIIIRTKEIIYDGQEVRVAVVRDISDRKRYENELKQSEERYKNMYIKSPVMLYSINKNGDIVNASDLWLKKIGYTREELIGKKSIDLLTKDSQKIAIEKVIPEFFINKRTNNAPFQMVTKQGTIIEVLISAILVEDPFTNEIYSYTVINDVTDQKKAEFELRLSEEKYKTLSESSPVGIISTDINGDCTYANPKWLEMTGMTLDETLGRGWINGLHPNDRDIIAEKWYNTINSRGKWEYEYRFQNKHGKTTWVYGLANIIYDIDKKIIGYIGNNIDITYRKVVEEKFKEQEKILKDILEATLSGYWDWNLKENTEYLSPSFKKMFGYEDHELVNSPETWQKIIHQDDLPKVFENFEMHVKSHGNYPYSNEVRYHHKDGSIIWVICVGRVIEWDAENTPIRMVGCHINITERKKIEQELIQAQQNALLSNELKNQFITNISHEIRTPLNGIIGMTDLTLLTELNDEQKDNLELIKESATLLNDLIIDLLDFSKIEKGQLKIQNLEFDLYQFINTIINLYENRALQRDFKLTYYIDANVPNYMISDYGKTRQILKIVMDNAFKFTNQGGNISLNVNLFNKNKKNINKQVLYWLQFRVQDDGVGIPEGKSHLIFNSFTQLDGSHTRNYGGSGLGLTLAKKLLDLMGGEIWYESELYKGSIFYFIIPILKTSNQKSNPNNPDQYQTQLEQKVYEKTMKLSSTLKKLDFEILQRKKTEQKIYESEERFRCVMEYSPFGIAIFDADGILIKMNKQFMDTWGVSQTLYDNFIGKFNIWKSERVNKLGFRSLIEKAFNGETVISPPYKSGINKNLRDFGLKSDKIKDRWLRSYYYSIKNTDGQLINLVLINIDITEQTIANQKQQEYAERLEFINDINSDFAYCCKLLPNGLLQPLWHIGSFEKISGYTSNKFYKQNGWSKLIHPEDYHKYSNYLNDLTLGKSGSIIVRIINKKGEIKWIEDKSKPWIEKETSKIIGSHSSTNDITETIKAKETIRLSEEKYSLLFNKMLDGFALHEIICDEKRKPIDYKFISVNPAFEKLTGLKANDIIGKTVLEVLPGTETYWIEKYGDVAITGKPIYFENYAKELNKYFYVTAFRPEENHFVCLFQDVTQQKLIEQSLRESEKRFKSIVMDTAAGYFFIDKDGIIQDVNNACINMYKYTSATEVIGKHFAIVQKIDDTELANEFVNGILNGNQKYMNGEFSRKCKDGSEGYHSFSARPVTKNDEIIGIEGFIIDTTKNKQAEISLKKAYEEKDFLLRELQHRVKNSINMISSLIQLKLNGSTETQTKNILNELSSRIKAMSLLYNMLYETGDINKISLDDYCHKVVHSIIGCTENITLQTELDKINTSSKKAATIGLILVELITNSMKYAFSENQSGKISIILSNNDKNFLLTVLDNGVGFPKNFDLSETKSMGLKLVEMMVNQLDGTIKIDNEQGTSIQLTIPHSDY